MSTSPPWLSGERRSLTGKIQSNRRMKEEGNKSMKVEGNKSMKDDDTNQEDEDIEEAVTGMRVQESDVKIVKPREDFLQDGEDSVGDQLSRFQQRRNKRGLFTDAQGNLRLVNFTVKYPCCVFSFILMVAVSISIALLLLLVQTGENPFADPSMEYNVHDIRSIQYDSLKLARRQVTDRVSSITAPQQPNKHRRHNDTRRSLQETDEEREWILANSRPQEVDLDFTIWVFESQTDDLFGSAESIKAMKDALDIFINDPDYQKYCRRIYFDSPMIGLLLNTTSDNVCMPPLTSLYLYYAKQWDSDTASAVIQHLSSKTNVQRYNALAICLEYKMYCDQVPPAYNNSLDWEWATQLNQNISRIAYNFGLDGSLQVDHLDQITLFAANLLQLDTKRGLVEFGFDSLFSVDNPKSRYSRIMVNWGAPLTKVPSDGIKPTKNEDMDEAKLKSYVINQFLGPMETLSDESQNTKVHSYYFMGVLILEVLFKIVQRDAMLAIASFFFVFIYMRIAINSWFLALVGMLEITLAIPISWFLFTYCFKIKYFSFLNALCLFIVAAIGADDIFIFMEAYQQSAYHPDPEILKTLESRMSWVYRRTGSAMFITSATTCCAFLCTLITPLAGVRAFGVFAATVILINYLLVMSLFCTAVVIYHNKFETRSCCVRTGCCLNTDPNPTQLAREDPSKQREDRFSRFFRNQVANFVLNPWMRFLLALALVVWLTLATLFALKIEPTKESEQFLNENHPLQQSIRIFSTEFNKAESDEGTQVHFVWGLGHVNRNGVHQLLRPDYFGEPTFLENFELNEKCQTSMLAACDDLKTNNTYSPYIKQVNGIGSVSCFLEELAAFNVMGNLDNCDAVISGAWRSNHTNTWQIPVDELPVVMPEFLKQTSCYSDVRLNVESHYKQNLGWDGSQIKFAGFSVESNVLDPYGRQSELVVRKEYDFMQQVAANLDSVVTQHCAAGSKVIMTDLNEKFIFMNNQAIYVQSAWQSALLGVAIAFGVLLISTRVLHIALLATFTIVCVLVSVTGTMVMFGWQLGSIEAILIAIVTGFSVDYVVHLAHAYERANAITTQSRLRAAFGEMGISVLNGMMTSVGASIPLFFCQLQFFSKFGTFMCLMIAFSWLFANFLFMGLLATFQIPIKRRGWNW